MKNHPHALYRFFNSRGALLYVGITMNPGQRWHGHRSGKPWWDDVATITLERFPDEASCRAAEREAILTENPLHNQRRPRPPRTPMPARFRELSDGTMIDLDAHNVGRVHEGVLVETDCEPVLTDTGRLVRPRLFIHPVDA